MAGESCVFRPTVINKEGKEVESRLFNDLLHFSSNDREFAKRYYFIGSDEEFLRVNGSKVKYDENGEITFSSLKNLVKLNLDEEKLLSTLNKDLKAGTYNYEEAITLLEGFNNTSAYSDEYMAIITPVDDWKVQLSVVKKNRANQAKLEEVISNKLTFDKIKQRVEEVGGNTQFIDERYSKYDTANAQRAESGLYNVIFLSKNGNLTADMAEEAGHFAVGALGNNPLVTRLERILTPEVQESILGEHYDDVRGRNNPRREAAGHLVGKFILKEFDNTSTIGKLTERVVNLAKRMFYKLTLNEAGQLGLEAQNIAKNIAHGFISGNMNFSIESALERREVLYSAKDSIQVATLKKVLQQLNLLTSEMSAIDKSLYDKWHIIEARSSIGKLFQNPSAFADYIAMDGITEAISQLADATPEIIDLIDSVDYDPNLVSANAKKLRQVEVFIKYSKTIMGIINNMRYSNKVIYTESTKKALDKAYHILSGMIEGDNRLEMNLLEKQRKLYSVFLQNFYGEAYVERASRVLFDTKSFKLKRVEGGKEYFEDLLTDTDTDDNMLSRWLSSMADSTDLINQLAYKAKSAAQRFADDNTIKAWEEIRALESKFKKEGINTNRLIERSNRDGKLTGNYISEYNWGDWENDWIQFKTQEMENFKSDPSMEGRTQIEKEVLWDNYFRPKMIDWHKRHSTYDKASGKNVPNDSYINPDFTNLTIKEKNALKELLEIKGNLDDLLTYQSFNGEMVEAAHTNLYRMPQFRGSTMNRIENLKAQNPLGKAVMKTLRQDIINAFTVTSEDRDYGSAETHNTLDEDILSDKLYFEKEKIQRVPIYGINKFKDTSELSTDLFNGLLQYAAMANTYVATSSVVDILATGKNVLANRTVKGLELEKDRKDHSRSYSRYIDFLDAQVYNIYAKKQRFGKFIIPKIANTLSSLASKVFLGGNIAGGMINVSTGFIEITKEAIAGEHFSIADLKKANAIYVHYLPQNLLEAGMAVKNNKVSLFMRKFNVQNNLDIEARKYSTRENRLTRLNPFGNNLMLPYKSGDHYMQSMAYIATANRFKFRNKEGNIISLWDALEPVNIDKDNPKAGKTLEFKEGVKYIDETGAEREWNLDDEVKFVNLCREVNNRMHGIYNKMDQTAFHRNLFGQMLLAMRGYALGLLQRRFATNYYSISLGHETEGSMLTFGKMIWNMLGTKGQFLDSARLILCPFGKGTERTMLDMGFSAAQYRNMRRNWADFAFIAILGILKMLTAKGEDDDDAEDDVMTGLLYYGASRLYREQNAYNTIRGMWEEQKSVFDLTPSGISVLGQLGQIGWMLATQEEYKTDSYNHEEGDLKAIKKIKGYIPYYRSINVFEHPYEAAKAYEYGRATYK